MLKARDFITIQAQATIFTPGLNLHTTRVLAKLLDAYADAFNGDPITIPVPSGFPLADETVRFILQSKDGKLRVQAAPSRLDVIQAGDNLDISRPLPEYLTWCLDLFNSYLDVAQGRVGRLASVVIRRASPTEPAKELASHFCKEALLAGPLNRPSDFEIHAAKKFQFLENLQINSWFRCKTATLLTEPRQAIVVVEQDFNSLPEEMDTRDFDKGKRRQFFADVPGGLQSVLELYFPN